MRQVTHLILLFSVSLFLSAKSVASSLITNDFGILTEEDLHRFDGDDSSSFDWTITGLHYWQCFDVDDLHIWYEEGEYDDDEKIKRGIPHVLVENQNAKPVDFIPRRAFSLTYAIEQVTTWKELVNRQAHVCISGIFAGTSKEKDYWIYEAMITTKGCDSYFKSNWCPAHN